MNKSIKNETIFLPNCSFFAQTLGYVKTEYHSHDFYEVFYVISGQVLHEINGVHERLQMGDMVFLRPGEHHAFIFDNSEFFLHTDILFDQKIFNKVCLFLNSKTLDNLFDTHGTIKIQVTNEQIIYFEKELLAIKSSVITEDKNALILSFLSVLISRLIKHDSNELSLRHPLWLRQLIDQLNMKSALQKSKEEIFGLLDSFKYNRAYISRAFKQHMHISMTEYINNNRFSTAYSLLLSSDNSISDILNTIGLTNKSYFYREFHKRYKTTPRKLREEKHT